MDSPYIDERLYAHRRIPRQHMPVPLLCKVSRNKHSALGWVRDFSRTGANVTSSLPLLPGDELMLSVPAGRRPELTITATVRWTQGPLVGVEFKPTIRNLFSSI
jgi:PilZ domain